MTEINYYNKYIKYKYKLSKLQNGGEGESKISDKSGESKISNKSIESKIPNQSGESKTPNQSGKSKTSNQSGESIKSKTLRQPTNINLETIQLEFDDDKLDDDKFDDDKFILEYINSNNPNKKLTGIKSKNKISFIEEVIINKQKFYYIKYKNGFETYLRTKENNEYEIYKYNIDEIYKYNKFEEYNNFFNDHRNHLPILNLLNNDTENEIISLNHNLKCNVYPCCHTTDSYDIIRSIQDYYDQKNNIIKCPTCNRIIIKYSLI
jgi:hypothetical protein